MSAPLPLPRSIAASTPSTAEWVLDVEGASQQCAAVQRFSVAMIVVALPLLVLWQLERRARRRFELAQAEEAHRALAAAAEDDRAAEEHASRAAAQLAVARAALQVELQWHVASLAVELYLISTGVWAAVVSWGNASSSPA